MNGDGNNREGFGPLTVQLFCEDNTEGDKTIYSGSLLQYFTTRTEKAPLPRLRRLDICLISTATALNEYI